LNEIYSHYIILEDKSVLEKLFRFFSVSDVGLAVVIVIRPKVQDSETL